MKSGQFNKLTEEAGQQIIRLILESQDKIQAAIESIEEEAADHPEAWARMVVDWFVAGHKPIVAEPLAV